MSSIRQGKGECSQVKEMTAKRIRGIDFRDFRSFGNSIDVISSSRLRKALECALRIDVLDRYSGSKLVLGDRFVRKSSIPNGEREPSGKMLSGFTNVKGEP